MICKKYIICVICFFLLNISNVFAHTGGTASDGCHKKSGDSFRHCHSSTPSPTQKKEIFSLSIKKLGNGLGTVKSDKLDLSLNYINCGDLCDGEFRANNFIQLTAEVEENSFFVGWDGECSQIGSYEKKCAVNMNKNQTIKAHYKKLFAANIVSTPPKFFINLDALNSYDSGSENLTYRWDLNDKFLEYGEKKEVVVDSIGGCFPKITLNIIDKQNKVEIFEKIFPVENCVWLEFLGLKEQYNVGDSINVDIKGSVNVGGFGAVDLWIAIKLPDDSLFFKKDTLLNSFSLKPNVFMANLETVDIAENIIDLNLDLSMKGEYTFFALFVDEGTNPLVDNVDLIKRSDIVSTKTIVN
ncbi:hypothetical protein QUF74_11135 [Candidatus Halobeggiatoa sp. HSG11]|nr:hypothetical protein [Candidatus Halobeggiatoa sp. HSG11]